MDNLWSEISQDSLHTQVLKITIMHNSIGSWNIFFCLPFTCIEVRSHGTVQYKCWSPVPEPSSTNPGEEPLLTRSHARCLLWRLEALYLSTNKCLGSKPALQDQYLWPSVQDLILAAPRDKYTPQSTISCSWQIEDYTTMHLVKMYTIYNALTFRSYW